MKIVFLCGSLEPGRDGVGDYTRRLAIELLKNGHQIGAIALNDQHISGLFDGSYIWEGIDLPILRIPSVAQKKECLASAKEWIDRFNPQWLSLQFVPFAFHPKGLSFSLNVLLATLGKGRSWHIMFHELWVGMDMDATKKHVYWGKLQRYLIRSLLEKLKPAAIHTQSRLYIEQLLKLGFTAGHLPLFSNIPVTVKARKLARDRCLRKNLNEEIYLVVFGSIHPDSLLNQLVEEVSSYSKINDVTISLKLIGRIGEEQRKWIAAWKSANMKVEVLGEQSPEVISEVLASAAVGVSTCAFPIIDKSGTVSAMLEHGLPVLCVAKPWFARDIKFSIEHPRVLAMKEGAFEACISGCHSDPVLNSLSEISRTMISCLEKSNIINRSA